MSEFLDAGELWLCARSAQKRRKVFGRAYAKVSRGSDVLLPVVGLGYPFGHARIQDSPRSFLGS